jgi:hypothetical protein
MIPRTAFSYDMLSSLSAESVAGQSPEYSSPLGGRPVNGNRSRGVLTDATWLHVLKSDTPTLLAECQQPSHPDDIAVTAARTLIA